MKGRFRMRPPSRCSARPHGGAKIERRSSVSDDQVKENTEEPKDDVEAHKWQVVEHQEQVVEQNDEPDVEGHVFDHTEMVDKPE
jgi:hypothetical protein